MLNRVSRLNGHGWRLKKTIPEQTMGKELWPIRPTGHGSPATYSEAISEQFTMTREQEE